MSWMALHRAHYSAKAFLKKICRNLFSSFCAILLTDQQTHCVTFMVFIQMLQQC